MTTLTRAEMEARYGQIPITVVGEFKWTICRSHADVTWVTKDGGETWKQTNAIWAQDRAQRDMEALEMQRIQREEK